MGSISFLLPDPLPPDAAQALQRSCFATGYDMAPVPTGLSIEGNRLVVTKNLDESGYLLVPWPVRSVGSFVTATSTLRETSEPYRLLVELARGKLNQVRTQSAEWEGIGLRLPSGFDAALNEATRLFAGALLAPPSGEADA